MINLSKKLLRRVGQTNAKYKMFERGDKILLALSGGKDSMSLAHVLKHFQSVSPLDWEFRAVTVTYGIGEDLREISAHFKEHEIPYEIIDTKIFEFGKEKIRANTTFCSFCSRMRRGYIYSYALEHGFNKIAIAHHLDDAAESFFMNFTFNGAIRTLAPRYVAENGLVIIRPFILARERAKSQPAPEITSFRLCARRRSVPRGNTAARNPPLAPLRRSFWRSMKKLIRGFLSACKPPSQTSTKIPFSSLNFKILAV